MALSRKLLSALGIEADKVEQIIEAHTETVEALKHERDDLKAKLADFDKVQSELEKLKDAAKNGGDYEKLKKQFEDYKAEVEGRETLSKKKAALEKVAKDAGLSENGVAKAVKYADFSKIELDDKGEIKDSKELLKSIKEEWADYVQTKGVKGADTGNPPKNSGGGTYSSKAEIMKIKDASERQKAIAENINLFKEGE